MEKKGSGRGRVAVPKEEQTSVNRGNDKGGGWKNSEAGKQGEPERHEPEEASQADTEPGWVDGTPGRDKSYTSEIWQGGPERKVKVLRTEIQKGPGEGECQSRVEGIGERAKEEEECHG